MRVELQYFEGCPHWQTVADAWPYDGPATGFGTVRTPGSMRRTR